MAFPLSTEGSVVNDLASRMHLEGLDLFKGPQDLGTLSDIILDGLAAVYDLPDAQLLEAIDPMADLLDFDCYIKGNSFYQFKAHFERSGQTEVTLERFLFMGQAEPGMFTRSHLKAWQEYMKQLRTKYSSPDLFRYRLSLMGLEGSEALDMAWDPKKTQAVYKQLKQANQLE